MDIRVNGLRVANTEGWVANNSHNCDRQNVTVGSDGSVSASVPGWSVVTVLLPTAV